MSASERALRRTIDRWTDDGMTADQLLDFVAGVEAIRAEATAAAEQRLRASIEAELVLRSDESDPFEQGCDAAYHFVLSLLGTPPSASPRQGEPVAVARFIEAVRRSALLGRREPTVMLRMWVKYAEVIQRHYAALSEPAEAEQKEKP